MTTGNGVPDASDNGEDIRTRDGGDSRDGGRQLRDIEELVAKLQVVTKQLEFPPRSMPAQADMTSVSWG
jgi:hypothetical protein